jgi:ABC-2 type transport system ATP-binding protein
MNAIIMTQGLTRAFNSLIAVDHLDLCVSEGEIFGLLGPNGAGKTTTIKMLTTLLPPTEGHASLAGYDIQRQAAQVRRLIGYVPQMISADGTLSGYENLLIFAKLYDLPRRERTARVRQALDFMGLADAGDKLVRQYSGGMIRRLEIAQSTLHHPRILFLDEPTVGLDPAARHMVWDHIRRLGQDFDTTVLVTTHLMEEAEELCQRVAIMNLGKIVASGTPSELKASIDTPHATLDDVFIYYTGNTLETGGNFREINRARRTARRLG